MSTHDAVAVSAIRLAAQSIEDLNATLTVVQANINRGELADAEGERSRLHAIIDDFMDQSLIAGRMIQLRRER